MKTNFKIKNRFLSLLLALVMVFGVMPITSVTAAEHIGVNAYTAEDVKAMIDALPDASELEDMDNDELSEVHEKAQDTCDAFEALTEEQQAELAEELTKLRDVLDFMTNLTATAADNNPLDISASSVTISKNENNTLNVQFNEETKTYSATEQIVITGETTTNRIVVQSGNPTVVLQNCTILREGNYSPFDIQSGASVTLILNGTNVIKTSFKGSYTSGIHVPNGASVTIDGSGTLEVKGGYRSAGIGGDIKESAGSITINGGTVNATAPQEAAGIGGGSTGSGGTVTITGGNVKAYSKLAKAIGAGLRGSAGTLTDGNGNALSLQTLTLDGAESASVTAITGSSYGVKDVSILDTNKLYFYLADDVTVDTVTAGGNNYICKDSSTNTYYTAHDWSKNDGVCVHCGNECTHPTKTENVCDTCGEELHVHNWEYTINGFEITATCSNTDGKCEDINGGSCE